MKTSFLTQRNKPIIKSMVKKKNEPEEVEMAEMKKSSSNVDYFKSKPKKKLKELEDEESERPIRGNEVR